MFGSRDPGCRDCCWNSGFTEDVPTADANACEYVVVALFMGRKKEEEVELSGILGSRYLGPSQLILPAIALFLARLNHFDACSGAKALSRNHPSFNNTKTLLRLRHSGSHSQYPQSFHSRFPSHFLWRNMLLIFDAAPRGGDRRPVEPWVAG